MPDRSRERRRADLGADGLQLGDHLVEPVAGPLCPEVEVDRRDQSGRKAVLGGPGGDARRERRDGLVADVLVDQVRCPPEGIRGDARLEAEAVQDARQRLARGAVEDEGDGVHGAGEQVDTRAGGLDRGGERAAARTLAVEPDRQVARLADRLDQLADAVGSSEPDGSWIRMRAAPNSGRRCAWATSASVSPDGPGL